MMDDTSQVVDMETSVSSTTGDLPESQEVTHCNVEMVIVVEQVKKEKMDVDNGETSSGIPEKSDNAVESSPKQSPQKDVIKLVPETSPSNFSAQIVLENDLNEDQVQITSKKSTESPNEPDTPSEEILDSSSKCLTPNSLNINISESDKAPTTEESIISLCNNRVMTVLEKPIETIEKRNQPDKPEYTTQTIAKTTLKTGKPEPDTSFNTDEIKKSPIINIGTSASDKLKNVIQIKSPLKNMGNEEIENRKVSMDKNDSNVHLESIQSNKSQTCQLNNEKPVNIIHIKRNMVRITNCNESGKPFDTTQIKKTFLKKSVETDSAKCHDFIQSKKSPIKSTTSDDSVTPQDSKVSKELMQKRLSVDELPPSPIQIHVEKTGTLISNDKKEEMLCNVSVDICEKSNDSQVESTSDISEKDHHNRSISRELKSLIKSAKESKIISECTQLTSKTRKSRMPIDVSNTSLNNSMEADKVLSRRSSNHSQNSESLHESNEKNSTKRSMRSQNPEFVNKVKQFLNSVTGKCQKGDFDEERLEDGKKDKNEAMSPSPKRKKQNDIQDQLQDKTSKLRCDQYCWRCHWHIEQSTPEKGHPPLQCKVCPRSFHFKCLSGTEKTKLPLDKTWVCPECLGVLHAESSDTRSPAMKKISLSLLCELLQYALERMMDLNGVEPFMQPVDRGAFPDYDKYVVHPMDLTLMKESIAESLYGSTEAFLADAQWILHNSIIFNTFQSKLTAAARTLVRACRAEIGEIEACPECYAAAHARRPTWFTDVCSTPHILLWAKLKGFPYWPAKGMSVNSSGLVDVRFFGAHDRAWVPAKDCFLYSEKDPNNFRTKRQDILDSMQEAEQHISSISRKYGQFVYPPFKTQFDPTKLNEQLKMMIPSFDGELQVSAKEKLGNNSPCIKKVMRSSSKNSKSSANDGEISEGDGDEPQITPARKMSGGAEIAREEEDLVADKAKSKDEEVQNKEKPVIKKRRRSELEEAVITVIDSSNSEKRKCLEKDKGTNKTEQEKDKNVQAEEKAASVDNNSTPTTSKTSTNDTPGSSSNKATPSTTPVKLTHKIKITRTSMGKDKDKDKDSKPVTPKQKPVKVNKTPQSNKEKTLKSEKRRHSRSKTLNILQITKANKSSEKKDYSVNTRRDNTNKDKSKDAHSAKSSSTNVKSNVTDSPKSIKDKIQFDDDITLAVIARETAKGDGSGLPTISSVRSLSTAGQNTSNSNIKSIEITIEKNNESSIFTPTSTDNVRNMKEAVNKLEKLRSNAQPSPVGRVGVCAFARMMSPDNTQQDNVEVEIKGEPIDFDDADRQVEKMDLMNAFRLRPVNPTATASLRDVRINKVVVTPTVTKTPTKPQEVRVKARKTFPQPRKPDERSELNGKNSMVYIPIQPPTAQAPVRTSRTITINANSTIRPQLTTVASGANTIVNTLTTPLVSAMSSTSTHLPTTTVLTNIQNSIQCGPTVGHIPTTVHTVPLITSVNGQCFFSLQPVMSVGGVDNPPPVLTEVTERNPTALLPLANSSPLASGGHVTSVQPIANGTSSDATPEMPRLQQRPLVRNPLDVQLGFVPTPSTAGPFTAKLNQNAAKLTDFFRTLLEDTLEKVDEPVARLTSMKLKLEQAQWRHQQEIKELKHNHELTVVEMRAAHEKEKTRAANDAKRAAQAELDAAVKAAKAKQWCANCSQEAQFYCCWNTSYCDYPCQRAHWPQHSSQCTQERNQDSSSSETSSLEKRLQPAPDNLPKNTSSPALTVGGKIANRVYSKEQNTSPKTSIIVSMVDDHNGGQTVKCVGTYKPGAPAQMPLLINKQVMSTEESGKKVVTSGGYLIVGSNNGASLVTPRRAHTIQYYT